MDHETLTVFGILVTPVVVTVAMARVAGLRRWAAWPLAALLVLVGGLAGSMAGVTLRVAASSPGVRCGLPLVAAIISIAIELVVALAVGVALLFGRDTRPVGVTLMSRVVPLFLATTILAGMIARCWPR